MSSHPKSQNFEFLRPHAELLAAYAALAEQYVFSDPNTCFLKLRQFGECLAKTTAHRAGLDCRELTFDETLNLLRRHNLVHNTIRPSFYEIKRYGNLAAHGHEDNQQAALECLTSAFDLANWFMKLVAHDTEHEIRPFQVPESPADATSELQQELDLLREQAARAELRLNASREEIEALIERNAQQAAAHARSERLRETEERDHHNQIRRLEAESERELRTIASLTDSSEFRSLLTRNAQSTNRLGVFGKGPPPFTRIRFTAGRRCQSCDAPLVLAQQMHGGFVKQCCPVCSNKDSARTLSRREFEELDIHVECPRCRYPAQPSQDYNYIFRCLECCWECELASLLPSWSDLGVMDKD